MALAESYPDLKANASFLNLQRDLVPCRRMPIVVGNLLKDNMYDLYKNNKVLKDLRKNKIPDDCKNCENSNTCRGGLKCLTYAIYKDLNHKDVGCNI